MTPSRRECLGMVGSVAAAWALGKPERAVAEATKAGGLRVGMCDWSMNRKGDVSAFGLAQQIGLDGVQVSVGRHDEMFLRDAAMQKKYLEASKESGVAIAATAMGFLNSIPLASEPRTAIWALDTIEITKQLGTQVILLAFFPPNGELKEENKDDMRRVTELLMELAPRAEKAGVILGLENYLRAEANLKIIEKVKSPAVQIYYDVYNSWVSRGHDPAKEIKLMGSKICQVHLKEGPSPLGESGKIDWPEVAAELKAVNYKGWLILETSSRGNAVVEDTRKNMEYVRKTFAALA
jgi:L-ribulose-5-phosphate 3-epimerase